MPGVCPVDELLDLCKHQLWSKAFQEAHASQYWTAAGVFPKSEAKQLVNPVRQYLLVLKRVQAMLLCGTEFHAMLARLITVLPGLTVKRSTTASCSLTFCSISCRHLHMLLSQSGMVSTCCCCCCCCCCCRSTGPYALYQVTTSKCMLYARVSVCYIACR